jgi:hypothetical protein
MVRMHRRWLIGIALLAAAGDRPEAQRTTIFSVELRRIPDVLDACEVQTTPRNRTKVSKRNTPTLKWEVKQVKGQECEVSEVAKPPQIINWRRYPVRNGLCDMTNPPIQFDPTEPNTRAMTMVKKNAIIGCYKYTVFFTDKVQQDPELEIVP